VFGTEYLRRDWVFAWSMSPELSVARTPDSTEVLDVQRRRRHNKQRTLNMPWPSERKDCGSCPSTGPAPEASRVLSDNDSAHP
jgi:hypothetical protein